MKLSAGTKMVNNESDYIRDEPNDQCTGRTGGYTANIFTYEHFPVVCPTCEGKGEIDKDISSMVTFVPVKDERLRPAWTKAKVSTLLLIILSMSGILTYFMSPRKMTINITSYEVHNFDFNYETPWISYQVTISVNNNNFFPVHLKEILVQILYLQVLVGKKMWFETIRIGFKTNKEIILSLNATYEKTTAKYIKQQCYKDKYFVPHLVLSSAEISDWLHDEHIESKDDYFYTDCTKMIFPLPTKKITTKPTTPLVSTHQPTKNNVSPNKTIVTETKESWGHSC